MARALLSRKADPNVVNKHRETALDLCDRPDQRVIFILREFGASHFHELEPWWDSPWFKYPVATLFGLGMCAVLGWLLFDFLKTF